MPEYPVIGTIATMPSRADSFAQMLDGVLRQVDVLYVFLDKYDEVPAHLKRKPKCRVHLCPVPRLGAASRFLALRLFGKPAIVACFDDDIRYPADYVAVIRKALRRLDYRAVVGFHGQLFRPPYRSFVQHRTCLHFAEALDESTVVNSLGTGTAAFLSTALKVEPMRWRHPQYNDLYLAYAAARAGLPMISLPRPSGWIEAIAQGQADSLWHALKQDERLATELMRGLLAQQLRQPAVS